MRQTCHPHLKTWVMGLVMSAASVLAAPALGNSQEAADPEAFGKPGADCAALQKIDFADTDDAPATVVSAKPVKGEGAIPDYCHIEGYVWRNTRVKIQIPLKSWNGKLLVSGPGGQGGSLLKDGTSRPFGGKLAPEHFAPLARGYAFVTHDKGHYSALTESKWGWNEENRMIDYGFRAGHVANLFGKAVIGKFTGSGPKLSYYHSCSGGGNEAMMMAQRYPWDFNGIIAGSPSTPFSAVLADVFWHGSQLLRDPKGFDEAARTTLHKSVMAQCDALDGKKDGLIEDPRACKVDFSEITCTRGKSTNCLTPLQVDIARKIYDGPRDAAGEQFVFSTAMPGSELEWPKAIDAMKYREDMYRYLAFSPAPGPGWRPDVNQLNEYHKRMGLMEALLSANNPDLRPFKKAGGKLIVYLGWNDLVGRILHSTDYYETVERVMGGREATQDFYRLFMIPGMNHCAGGYGAWVVDYLTALEKWVETGAAPDALEGYHPDPDGSPEFTRIHKPYQSRKAD